MILTENLINGAQDIIRFEKAVNLPKKIGETPFYLAETDDKSILGHGVIEHDGKEYKIGTKIDTQEQ